MRGAIARVSARVTTGTTERMPARHALLGVVLGAFVVGIAALTACATTTISAGSDAPPAEAGPPVITGADSGPAPEPDGGLCNAYTCPAPYATCPDTSGLCTVNLDTDPEHCGDCDTVCPNNLQIVQKLHSTFACSQGRCHISCSTGFTDCDGFVDDGCEIETDYDPFNCGACGKACAPGEVCWLGACGCPPGYKVCDGTCAKTDDDIFNCGTCGNACDPSTAPDNDTTWPCGTDTFPGNTTFACAMSACKVLCAPGFADCNTDVCDDGCETFTDGDPDHCGDCNTKCKPEQICNNGKCICEPDKTRCGTNCVDLENDPANCGACDNQCPGPSPDDAFGHGSPLCVLGKCTYHCPPGFADCDHRIDNGCEVDLNTDPLHCGTCDVACDVAGGQPCGAGRCLTGPCDAGVVF